MNLFASCVWYTPKKFKIFNMEPENLNPQKKEIPNLEKSPFFRFDSFNFRGGVSWWLSKSCTTQDVWNHDETLQIDKNNGIDYQPQLVFSPDFWTINQYVS